MAVKHEVNEERLWSNYHKLYRLVTLLQGVTVSASSTPSAVARTEVETLVPVPRRYSVVRLASSIVIETSASSIRTTSRGITHPSIRLIQVTKRTFLRLMKPRNSLIAKVTTLKEGPTPRLFSALPWAGT